MNILIPKIVAHEIIIKCISSLSSSILSSYNLYNHIITNSNSDYGVYQKQITSTDLAHKLLLASSIIKDIIKKHHFSEKKDISIEKIIESYKNNNSIEITNDGGYDIITHIQNNTIISEVSEPVKIALHSTLEIIEKINIILDQIHNKIKIYSESYIKYISKLNLSQEVNILTEYNKIFSKRLELLFSVLKIYKDIV